MCIRDSVYVDSFLWDVYYIFNDSPAPRAEFIELTGKSIFPLKHCTIRWLENVPSIDRLLSIFDDIKKFVDSRKYLNTKPLKNVSVQTKDIFLKCKLGFFKNAFLGMWTIFTKVPNLRPTWSIPVHRFAKSRTKFDGEIS